MLPFVVLIINLVIFFRGDLKKKPTTLEVHTDCGIHHWPLSVVHGRSEHLEARMSVCFLDTWVPGWGAWFRSGDVG